MNTSEIRDLHYYKSWLNQLAVGDTAMLARENPEQTLAAQIIKILPSQIVVNDGTRERRINRNTGVEWGHYYWTLIPATEEEIEHIRLASDVHNTVWWDVDDRTLKEVVEIIGGIE